MRLLSADAPQRDEVDRAIHSTVERMGERGRGTRIAIIGAGAVGSSVFISLVRAIVGTSVADPVEIYLIDKTGSFGPGLAYATDKDYHILNMRARYMSLFADEPHHFVDWIRTNRQLFRLPEDMPQGDAYLPRRVFGAYIQHYVQHYLSLAL